MLKAASARIFLTLCVAVAVSAPAVAAEPNAKSYVSFVGKRAKVIPVGKLRIGGYRAICGRRPTVMDPKFDSWGGAYPGFMILNPRALRGLPRAVQLYVYSHECGHQFVGPDEDSADCFAVKRGVRRGWLKKRGMNQICRFISRVPGDATHPPGQLRCKRMVQCFKNVRKSRRVKKR